MRNGGFDPTESDGTRLRRWLVGIAWRVALIPAIAYVAYAATMALRQERILFPGAGGPAHPLRASLPLNARLVEIPSSAGRVRAVFWPARGVAGARAPAIVHAHGNFETIAASFTAMPTLTAQGVSVLQVEYPGYGGADGSPTYAAIGEAMRVAYDWLVAQPGVDGARVVAMGYSVGGGAACALTRERPVHALVLLSTFTSIADFARARWLPPFLVRYPWDNLACVRDFDGPVLVAHGRRDRVIAFGQGVALAAERPDTTFVPLDCGHEDCDWPQTIFAERLVPWLDAHDAAARREPSQREATTTTASPR